MLLDGAEFVVHGERVGIVGKNGAGKSTLFALLTGEIDQDAGDLSLPAGWRIASVEQEIHADERPAREFVIDGDTHLRELQARRAHWATTRARRSPRPRRRWWKPAPGARHSRAEQLLAGLGFKPQEWMQPVQSFSGGWRMRLALARALMAPSELLLLDEPTNHLDLDAMLWLEKWLAAYPGTVMLISHDTEFLDAVAKSIHFDHAKLVRYRGGYNDYLTQRADACAWATSPTNASSARPPACRASSTASRPRRPRPSRRRAGSRPWRACRCWRRCRPRPASISAFPRPIRCRIRC